MCNFFTCLRRADSASHTYYLIDGYFDKITPKNLAKILDNFHIDDTDTKARGNFQLKISSILNDLQKNTNDSNKKLIFYYQTIQKHFSYTKSYKFQNNDQIEELKTDYSHIFGCHSQNVIYKAYHQTSQRSIYYNAFIVNGIIQGYIKQIISHRNIGYYEYQIELLEANFSDEIGKLDQYSILNYYKANLDVNPIPAIDEVIFLSETERFDLLTEYQIFESTQKSMDSSYEFKMYYNPFSINQIQELHGPGVLQFHGFFLHEKLIGSSSYYYPNGKLAWKGDIQSTDQTSSIFYNKDGSIIDTYPDNNLDILNLFINFYSIEFSILQYTNSLTYWTCYNVHI